MHNQTRKITEGAMMIAILGVFMLINRQTVGLLDSYFAWLLPLPVIFLYSQIRGQSGTSGFVLDHLTEFYVGITGNDLLCRDIFRTGDSVRLRCTQRQRQ